VTAKILKENIDKALLAFIFVALSISTIIWTLKDRTPPAWDPADHISAGYDYYSALAHFDFRAFADELFVKPRYYAPFVHLATGVIFLVSGASRLSGIAINIISLGVLLYSTAWICRALYHGDDTARADSNEGTGGAEYIPSILAAILASCYHFSAWLMHDAFLDFPLMAIVTACFALLLRAGDFTSRSRAVQFGIAAGIGMLTKQTFPFFFVLPSVYVAIRVLASRNPRAISNLILAAVVTAAIAALWYYPHLNDVLAIYGVNRDAATNENEAPVFSFMSNVFYLHALVSHQMQVPLGALFVLGLIYSLARRARQSMMLYLWILSGIAMFTLVANKDVRYSVPVLPAAAVISVCWMGGGRASRAVTSFKLALAATIAAWAFISFFNAQWPRDGQGYYIDTPRFRWMVFARNYYGFDKRPTENDWSVPEIVRTVSLLNPTGHSAQEIAPPGPNETVSPTTRVDSGQTGELRPTLGVIVNLPHLNPSSIALYARLLAIERAGPPIINVLWIVSEASRDRIESSDYLLVRTGLDRAEWVAPIERVAEQLINSNPDRFVKVASFPLPLEQAEAVIYRRGG
jgi:4-amino-4-deoxy-L-arabinose transferase-like glycosyltransferase